MTPLHSCGLGFAVVVTGDQRLGTLPPASGEGAPGANSSSNEIPVVSSAEASAEQRTNNVELNFSGKQALRVKI